MALKQRAEGYRNETGALEHKLALIKAQRNKLLAAFEGFAGTALRFSPLFLSFPGSSFVQLPNIVGLYAKT